MNSMSLETNQKSNRSALVKKLTAGILAAVLFISLLIPMPGQSTYVEAADGNLSANYMDKLIFGNPASENEHVFKGASTVVITGGLGAKARVSKPLTPVEAQGGDLIFKMKVDPHEQNYFTLKFWGDDSSSYTSTVNINGEQVGYYRKGDYQAINMGNSKALPGRFFYNTVMLPIESTNGLDTVEITIKTLNIFGKMEADSRGYYNAYTHTQPSLNVSSEVQGEEPAGDPAAILASEPTEVEKQALLAGYTQGQINQFNGFSSKVDASSNAKLSIVRYQDELRFYANALSYDWSLANSPELKQAAIKRIFKVIDNHVKDYYGDTRLVLRGGHQGDWGGYYGALGEALYIVENLIKDDGIYGEQVFNDFLDEAFVTGTVEGPYSLAGVDWAGGELTRREAWERVLKANFDFARSRLSNIYNQILYTYEGAWEAHEGLRLINSSYYEGKQRSREILLEALGARPFLGEEVLVGPNGEELDVYHSLFYHDATAQFTDDYVYIIGKGLAKSKLDDNGNVVRRLPFGEFFTGITDAGLTRENNYVGNYGEAANYLPEYVYKTANHEGDEQLNDEILKLALKNIYARGFTRYTELDDNGKRIMRMEQVIDERNPGLQGVYAYATRVSEGRALLFASLEKYMIQNEANYSGPEWEAAWKHASAAVGFVQQQIADHQFFQYFGNLSYKVDYQVEDTYRYITEERSNYDRFDSVSAGVVHPLTDFDYYTQDELASLEVEAADYEQLAWVDVDAMFVALRDGDTTIFGALNELNRGFVGNGRLHVLNGNYDHIVQIATNAKFQYEDYYLRMDNVDVDYMSDQAANASGFPQALAGEIAPITYQPGVGEVIRDNFEVDHAYAGYPDLLTARYGQYFMIFNSTRDEYGNKQTFEVEIPADYTGAEVLDLVTGQNIPVVNGQVSVSPMSALVLKLTSDIEIGRKPFHVDFSKALAGNNYAVVTWKRTSGAESYTIKRSETENGVYSIIAEDVQGSSYKDETAINGKTYYYIVTAVNKNGPGWDSYRAEVVMNLPITAQTATKWRDDRIGDVTAGMASIAENEISIEGADGEGFGTGDDYIIERRDINDSLHYVNQAIAGSVSLTAKVNSYSGAFSGIMLRDSLDSNTRYIYFGADEDGILTLQNRTRDSRHQWSNLTASPYSAGSLGLTADDYPYLRLVRDADSHLITAFVSKDGEDWTFVRQLFTPFAHALFAGVAAAEQASFSDVSVVETERGVIAPYIVKAKDNVALYWNKPKQAASFELYRTNDAAAGATDPVFIGTTSELAGGSPWTAVVKGNTKTFFQEASLKYGNFYYKVRAVYGDGTYGAFSETVSVQADSILTVMADAENLASEDYTKASYYLFVQELDRIKGEMAKPEFDEEQLILDIYQAHTLLVSYRTLLTRIPVEQSMVKASTLGYGNDNISAEQNGWYSFDSTLSTFTNTRLAESWITLDFGMGNEKTVDTVRFHGRTGYISRVNGSIVQGSQDGINWTDLYTMAGAVDYQWYSGIVSSPVAYQYIRVYDNHAGYSNYAEIELLEMGMDRTLLTYLLNEAEAVEASIYTEESLANLAQEAASAKLIFDAADALQAAVDDAANRLQTAFAELKYLEGVPVLAPIGNKTITAEGTLSFLVRAEKAEENLQFSVQNLPSGAVFNAETQSFSWTPGIHQGGEHNITFTLSSGEKQSSRIVKITVLGGPIITQAPSTELVSGSAFSLKLNATDPLGEKLSYSVEGLPVGAVFNAVNGELSWKPENKDVGIHSVIFHVTNGRFTVSQTVQLNVTIPSVLYTKGSYYIFDQAWTPIESELMKPGASREQLAGDIARAVALLVPVSTLSEKIVVTSDMVTSSSVSYDNKLTAALNGWQAYDGNTATFTDAKTNPAWISVDFGEGHAKGIAAFRFYPRNTKAEHIARVNGSSLQGSNNETDWMNLYSINGITEGKWYTVDTTDVSAFRYIRYYSPTGNANVAELELFKKLRDNTLLELLLEEAEGKEAARYTEESYSRLVAAIDEAMAILSDAPQRLVDAAAANLQAALVGLTTITPVQETLTAVLNGQEQAVIQEEVAMSIGIAGLLQGFNALDLIVSYDPSRLEFAVQSDEAGEAEDVEVFLSVDDNVIVPLQEGLQVIGTKIVPEQGKIRIIMAVVDPNAIMQDGDLFELRARVRASAELGATNVSLSDFNVSLNGNFNTVNTEAATLTTVIKLADKAALNESIVSAGQLYAASVAGSQPGQYPSSAKEALALAIGDAKAVQSYAGASEAEVSAAVHALSEAVQTFRNSVNSEVSNPADKIALIAAIAAAQAKYDKAVEGVKVGQYAIGSKAALKIAIDAAVLVKNNSSASQSLVNQSAQTLDAAVQAFSAKFIALVEGAGKITIRDLSFIAKYFGTKANDANWNMIERADIYGDEIINIRTLAAVARMILDDWATE